MRKQIAFLLAFIMIIGFVPTVVANVQIGVDEFNIDNVFFVAAEDIITGEPIISPTMYISWEDPSSWANDIEVHDPDYYEITVDNLTTNTTNLITIYDTDEGFTSKTLELHNELKLDTGSLYMLQIQPYHYHTELVGGDPAQVLAPNTQNPRVAYGMTDLQVDFVSDEDSIQVIWDNLNIPELEYRIVYALGDYTGSTKQDLLNNAEGQIQGLTMDSDGVESYYDTKDQRDKLSYTIDEGIIPGQIYSIMVEPTSDYYDGGLITRNRNNPFIKSVSTNVQLNLVEEGENLRLQWEIPSSFKVGQDQDEYALVEGILTQFRDGKGSTLVIFDGEAAAVGYYTVQKPILETQYQLQLIYKAVDSASKPDIEPISNLTTYVPTEYLITPTRPYIPKVLTETTLDDLRATYTLAEIQDILEDDYLVPGYSYTGPLDDIFDENVTFTADTDTSYINFVWGAFRRIDVDVTSPTYGEYITDTNVEYDIWVTDELDTLAYAEAVLEDGRFTSTTDDQVITDSSNDIVGFRDTFELYYNTENNELQAITPGQLYYIKVQATKVTATGSLTSEPAITSIYFTYNGATYEPPTIVKPPMKVKESVTTEESVTVIWRENWYEVISPDLSYPEVLANWQHEVWVDDTTGEVYDESKDNTTYFPVYESQAQVEAFEDYLATFPAPLTIISRQVNLGLDDLGISDVKYKFNLLSYEYVLGKIEEQQNLNPDYSFEEYYNDLIEADKDGTSEIGYSEIIPAVDPDDSTYIGWTQDGLNSNTSYLFMILPYRELLDGTLVQAHYPTPIIVSTDPVDEPVTPDPKVPNLYITSASDSTLTLTWKYNLDFTYDIVYSREDDIDTAQEFPFELPENTLDPNYPVDGQYYDLEVDDLFPLTNYYFWIRANQTENNLNSLWSNPASGETIDVDVPIPPRGLGLAPLVQTQKYDYDYNVTEEYMILEWIRDLEDEEEVEAGTFVTRTYSYIIEVADNYKFIDPIYIVSSGGNDDTVPAEAEILEKTMVKINDLIPNRKYYVRGKTVLIVDGPDEDQHIEKESISYTEPLIILTLTTGSEYDGGDDPALSVLPDKDFELIYDTEDDMLVFRFRDDSTDGSGAADNNVDQRLITDLIADGIHEYEIDVDGFEGKNVDSRRIIIPYSIIEAFDSHQVDLKILADEMTIDLPAEAVIDPVKDQVKAFGVAPEVIIDINELDVGHTLSLLPAGSMKSAATPQKLGVQVKSSRRTDNIGYADEMMTIGMKTNSRYEVYGQDTVLYVQDSRAKWKTVESAYDKPAGMMMFETADIGSYGVYVEDHTTELAGNQNPSHWSEGYRQDVFSQITVSGLNVYNPDAYVSEKNVVQAVYGTAMDDTTIDLSASLTSGEMTTVMRAGLKNDTDQTDGTIARMEAIAMFVRAYEIINELSVPVESAAYNTVLADSTISGAYKTDITKAYSIGLISDLNNVRAGDAMTYGEFFTIWSRALN